VGMVTEVRAGYYQETGDGACRAAKSMMALKLEAREQLRNRPACLIDLQGYHEACCQPRSHPRSRLPCRMIGAARGEGGGASDVK